ANVGGWVVNLTHLSSLREARRRAQARRRVRDSDLRELQVGTATRLQAFFAHHLRGDARLRTLGDASRSAVDSVSDSLPAPATPPARPSLRGFPPGVVLGPRSSLAHAPPGRAPSGGGRGAGGLFSTSGPGGRGRGLGSPAPAPAAIALFALFGSTVLGAVGLA